MELDRSGERNGVRIAQVLPVAQTESERLASRPWDIRVIVFLIVSLAGLLISRAGGQGSELFTFIALFYLLLEIWFRQWNRRLLADKASKLHGVVKEENELVEYVRMSATHAGKELYRDHGLFIMSSEQWLFEGERVVFSNPVSRQTTIVEPSVVSIVYPDSELQVNFVCCSRMNWNSKVLYRVRDRMTSAKLSNDRLIFPPNKIEQVSVFGPHHFALCALAYCMVVATYRYGHLFMAVCIGILGIAVAILFFRDQIRRKRCGSTSRESVGYASFLSKILPAEHSTMLPKSVQSQIEAQPSSLYAGEIDGT